jgi:hypothetical protein
VSSETEVVFFAQYKNYTGPYSPSVAPALEKIQELFSENPEGFDFEFSRELVQLLNTKHGSQAKFGKYPVTSDGYQWKSEVTFTHGKIRWKFLFPKTGNETHPENDISDRHIVMYARTTTIPKGQAAHLNEAAAADRFARCVTEVFHRREFERQE